MLPDLEVPDLLSDPVSDLPSVLLSDLLLVWPSSLFALSLAEAARFAPSDVTAPDACVLPQAVSVSAMTIVRRIASITLLRRFVDCIFMVSSKKPKEVRPVGAVYGDKCHAVRRGFRFSEVTIPDELGEKLMKM